MSREEMSVWIGAEVILPHDYNQQMAETETKDVHIEISGVGKRDWEISDGDYYSTVDAVRFFQSQIPREL